MIDVMNNRSGLLDQALAFAPLQRVPDKVAARAVEEVLPPDRDPPARALPAHITRRTCWKAWVPIRDPKNARAHARHGVSLPDPVGGTGLALTPPLALR